MKTLATKLLLVVLILSSCKKNSIEEDKQRITLKDLQATTRPLPAGDPNLDPTWDWTQQSWTVYFNNANGSIGTVTTLNPFIDGSQEIYGTTDVQNADMYPTKGWILVARDFGTPTAANAYPFVVLYNKYRGILRVCILRTYDVLSSSQQIVLSFAAHNTYADVFKYSPPINIYQNSQTSNTKTSDYKQVAVTTAGVQEWMVSDFDVRGYSAVINDNLAFNISMSEIAQSDIVLNGNIQLNGTIEPQGGESTLDGIKNLTNFITSFIGLGSSIDAINGGSSGSTSAGSVSGVFNSLVDFISAVTTPPDGKGTYAIKINGTVSQKGTVTLKSPKTSFSVYLKNQSGILAYRAVQNISWGVINIGNWPYVSITNDPITTWVPDPNGGPDYSEVTIGFSRTVVFEPNFITKALVINPAVANEVAGIEVAYITNGDSPTHSYEVGTFKPIAQFEAEANNRPYDKNSFTSPIGWINFMAFGIKITFNNGAVVYQVMTF